jgi:light-harvesting protein B-800-850 alpha chain
MNNAKMWLVVKPGVGVPMFLAGVAIASFLVHVSVLSFAGWYGDYANGRELGAAPAAAAMAAEAPTPAAYTLMSH